MKNTMRLQLAAVLSAICIYGICAQGNQVTSRGAWCWFADARALHVENPSKNINSTYIGYIDPNGNIKATQHDFLTGITSEVLVRSYFQPDDHNNPTFLALPDGRIMIFYSRHTDEPCFYYRISAKAGDITLLGEEKRFPVSHNTTYPSPFILQNDPKHIYLCWRGINWHPTIARLTLPDSNDNISFDWGPKQIVQSSGARPYAKYASNGKDKIYLAYTTGHPDNENPNMLYFNYINIKGKDAAAITLSDVRGKTLSIINDGVHKVNKTTYMHSNPDAVVDNSASRNWVWQVAYSASGHPVIAMVKISGDKKRHDYYYADWTGQEWRKTFLASGGGHFHQTPDIEMCYSGGMAIDEENPNTVYCSVPVKGVYEIVKYTVNTAGYSVVSEALTAGSPQNNVRPYFIHRAGKSPLRLVWMRGNYYDWIVSASRPQGYPTAIYSDYSINQSNETLPLPTVHRSFSEGKGMVFSSANDTVSLPLHSGKGSFSISLLLSVDKNRYGGRILQAGDLSFNIDETTMKPFLRKGGKIYGSTNVLGNADSWQSQPRSTNGKWYPPAKFDYFTLSLVYADGMLTAYINGLIDQKLEIRNFIPDRIVLGGFAGTVADCKIYNTALSQSLIKQLAGEDRKLLLPSKAQSRNRQNTALRFTKVGESCPNTDIALIAGQEQLSGQAFQQDMLLSYNGCQYVVYYNSTRNVCIARRRLPHGEWREVVLPWRNSVDDAHNVISLGICKNDGTIHLAYDHHNSPLHYTRSVPGLANSPETMAWDADRFASATDMLEPGVAVPDVTYPRFISKPDGNLLFECRYKLSGDGDSYLREYDGVTHRWSLVGRYVQGMDAKPNACAYINRMDYDMRGRLHVSWCWRDDFGGSSNHDIFYAYSNDDGRTWNNSTGSRVAVTEPINPTDSRLPGNCMRQAISSLQIASIPLNRGYINQESQSSDRQGRVHILNSYIPNDQADDANWATARAKARLHHRYRRTDGVWKVNTVKNNGEPVHSWCRAQIIADAFDNAIVIANGAEVYAATPAAGYSDWTLLSDTDKNRFCSEPQIDHPRLLNDGVLSFAYLSRDRKITIIDCLMDNPHIPSGTGLAHSVQSGKNFWQGSLETVYGEQYTLFVNTAHPVQVFVDGKLLMEKNTAGQQEISAAIPLAATHRHSIAIKADTGTVPLLIWQSAHTPKAAVPETSLYSE